MAKFVVYQYQVHTLPAKAGFFIFFYGIFMSLNLTQKYNHEKINAAAIGMLSFNINNGPKKQSR
jgi:hypothetical protein